ncbi:MAG: hypothetical protein FWH18_07275 [Marinilabiliaceae bacterium]|nr:hypothetical protein [Marinilabiliaceae bacterium]
MESKIAVTNFKNADRTLLAETLSCLSDLQLVQNRTMHEWEKIYNINETQKDIWENQFLLISSSFVKRIKSEFIISNFISNGAAFSEVLSLKAKINEKSIELHKLEEFNMLKSLLNITGRYAAEHYGIIIHVKNTDSSKFDDLSVRFYDKYRINYKLFDGDNNLKNIVENITGEIEIPKVQSIDSAIYKAERLVNFKNWKS